MTSAPEPARPAAQLGLWDAVSIIIGIVVGAGIYETPPGIFQSVSGPWVGLGMWALAGLLSLLGALCYAELATTYPRSGGDYVYLTRAYGPLVGFLFGWAQLAVVLTANIGMMAYVFADYAVRVWEFGTPSKFVYAAGAVVVLTLLNALGLVLGKGAQNVLTVAKVLGLGGVLAAACVSRNAAPPLAFGESSAATAMTWGGFAGAMVLLFITYGGWNDAAFVAAEVRDGRRNIPRALILGTLGITAIYLLVNAAYLWSLGFAGARQSTAIAAEVVEKAGGRQWAWAISILVMISALGAANGLILTGSRVCSTLGADYGLFAALGRWHPRLRTPVVALVTQAAIAVAMIALVGTESGQAAANAFFKTFNLEADWKGRSGFNTLLKCTAPIFWIFFALTALSLFVLRFKDRDRPRPFTVPLYPVVPLLFLATCGYMVYSGIDYAKAFGLVGAALLLIGVPLFFVAGPRPGMADVPKQPPAAEYV
jgi:amino acid transporter